MASYVSPGVYVRERDYSGYTAATGTTTVGFAISAQRGPLDTPRLITSAEAFISEFGNPSVNQFGPHAVLDYLKYGNQAWVCRVARKYDDGAAALVSIPGGTPQQILVAAGHSLNVGDYVRITQTGRRTSQNLRITAVTPSSPNYLVTLNGALLDDYDASSSSDTDIAASSNGAGTAPAEVFAYGRRDGNVFPLVKFTARDPGSFANFGSSRGIEVVVEDGGRFANVDPSSGQPVTSGDGIPLQGLMPSSPSVDTKTQLLDLIASGTARVGETRGVNFDSLVGSVTTIDSNTAGTSLRLTIPVSTGWEVADSVVVSGSGAYDGTYTVSAVTTGSTTTAIEVTGFSGTVPGLRAVATIVSDNSANATATRLLTIAGKQYTLVPSGNVSFEGAVLIGASADATLANIIAAINHTGTPGTQYQAAAAHPTVQADASVTAHTVTLRARTPGTAGNALTVTTSETTYTVPATFAGGTAVVTPTNAYLENADSDSHRFGTVYRCASGTSGLYWVPEGVLTKRVKILFQGNVAEIFDNIVGYDAGSPNFWNTVIGTANQPVSAYVTAEYLGSGGEQPISSYNRNLFPNNPRYVMGLATQIRIEDSPSAAVESYENAKGYDGDSPTAADYIGTVGSDDFHTGLQNFRKSEAFDLNLLTVPGVSLPAVLNEVIDICQTRHDCVAIVDPPLGLSAQEVTDWHNGTGAYSGLHDAFTSSFAALYWPWVRSYDPYTKRELLLPPSCSVPGRYAYSDSVGEAWFAPAGIQRGTIPNALGTERIVTQGDADLIYGPGNGNAINPIMTFAKDGVVVYGQRTMQRFPSALDRVNVRRLMCEIEKNISRSVRGLVFEQNDASLWAQFVNIVEPYLANLKGRRALEDFLVVCDATTNTPQRRNNNEMNAKIYVIPTKSAEKLLLDFTLLASGVSLSSVAAVDAGS